MVSNQDVKSPAEAAKPLIKERKEYVVIKNHVREFTFEKQNQGLEINNDECPSAIPEKCEQSRVNHPSSSEINFSQQDIIRADLEEIKAAYKQCKAILKKIELKYGRILHTNDDTQPTNKKRKYDDEKKCNCKLNKKIFFDDEGNEVVQNSISDIHICPKRLLSYGAPNKVSNQRVSVEEETYSDDLPNSLKELGDMLKNLNISGTLRLKIIKKIRSTRFENLNTMKLDKASLTQAVKSNADEVFEFKGSNVSLLQGYLPSK